MKKKTMRSRLNAFFARASASDISALLERTNYDFYRHVQLPIASDENFAFELTENYSLECELPMFTNLAIQTAFPITAIRRECDAIPAADHEDLALAA
jgi:hypothetical protein